MKPSKTPCPKCRDVDLIPLRDDVYRNQMKFCRKCQGLWLYKEALSSADGPVPSLPSDEAGHDDDADRKAGLCPFGHGVLLRARVDTDPAFFLDRCSTCGGVWFDRGELHLVAMAGLTEQLPDLWSLEWQRERRRKRHRQEYLEDMKNKFGEDLYQRLTEVVDMLKGNPLKRQVLDFLIDELRE